MSTDIPDRSGMDDDLDQAYAQAHSLADAGRGPAASVRAGVLAVAQEEAAKARAQAAAEAGAPPLTPVAPPVAEVGRGRAMAINLSSWRVRSGAAACAALLVVLGVWRFDESHRFDRGAQVATADLELAPAPTSTIPKELPAPRMPAASVPYLPPPAVDDPFDAKRAGAAARPVARERDGDVVVAQAEQPHRSLKAAPAPDARVEARRTPAPVAPPRDVTSNAAPPVAVAAATEPPPPAQSSTTVTITAAATPPQLATLPPMPPSVVPRRVPVAPPRAAPEELHVAQADTTVQRAEITGSAIKRIDGAEAASAAPRLKLAMADNPPRPRSTSLQAAADHGDLEALRALLADPATRVDTPDAAGRTALLHAVLAQQAGAVRLLLSAGADPLRADPAGLTPRAAAQAGASAEIAALLAPSR